MDFFEHIAVHRAFFSDDRACGACANDQNIFQQPLPKWSAMLSGLMSRLQSAGSAGDREIGHSVEVFNSIQPLSPLECQTR